MPFVATINVPGYLPMSDDPPVFHTAQEAWDYLLEERERGEDATVGDDYSETHQRLAVLSTLAHWSHADAINWLEDNGLAPDGQGTVYGDTPGYEGDHDLGLAYCVTFVSENDLYPEGTTTRLDCGCLGHNTRMTQWGFHCDAEDQGYCNFEHACGIDDE